MEELELQRMQRKQEIYRKMADRQIEEVFAQIMSLSDYDEERYIRMSAASQRTNSMFSEVSNSSDILNDSQDRI